MSPPLYEWGWHDVYVSMTTATHDFKQNSTNYRFPKKRENRNTLKSHGMFHELDYILLSIFLSTSTLIYNFHTSRKPWMKSCVIASILCNDTPSLIQSKIEEQDSLAIEDFVGKTKSKPHYFHDQQHVTSNK